MPRTSKEENKTFPSPRISKKIRTIRGCIILEASASGDEAEEERKAAWAVADANSLALWPGTAGTSEGVWQGQYHGQDQSQALLIPAKGLSVLFR